MKRKTYQPSATDSRNSDGLRVVLLGNNEAEQWRGQFSDWASNNAEALTLAEIQEAADALEAGRLHKIDMGAGGVFTLARLDPQHAAGALRAARAIQAQLCVKEIVDPLAAIITEEMNRDKEEVLTALLKLCDDCEQAAYHLTRHGERTRAEALDERVTQARDVIARAGRCVMSARKVARTRRVAPDSEEALALGFESGLEAGPEMAVMAVVLAYDEKNEFVGYYEALANGSFSCVVGRDSEWTKDEAEIQRWLIENGGAS